MKFHEDIRCVLLEAAFGRKLEREWMGSVSEDPIVVLEEDEEVPLSEPFEGNEKDALERAKFPGDREVAALPSASNWKRGSTLSNLGLAGVGSGFVQ